MLVIPPKEIDGKLKFRNNDVFVRDGITLTEHEMELYRNIRKERIAHVLSNLKKIKPPKSNLWWFFHTQNCIPNALPTGEAFFFCRHSSEAEQGAFNAQVGISKFPAGTTSALWHFRRKPKDRKHRTEPGNKCERKKRP